MNRVGQIHCCLFNCLLKFQSDDLIAHYGDEMRVVFRDEIDRARREGAAEVLRVWYSVICETVVLSAPGWFARAQLVFAATTAASVLILGFALGFCSLHASPIVHACSEVQTAAPNTAQQSADGGIIKLPDGHQMFLECSGAANAKQTVILVTGRGLGIADSWLKVQQRLDLSLRVCSYDAMGVGKSDPVQGSPQARPIDQVVADMHALFQSAHLEQPYVLVGASDGALLARKYQELYAKEVAGLVFVDSSHEEMEWRDAAVAPKLDPNWDNPVFLRNNGFLPNHQKLAWRTNVPLIDLERSEKAPASAFPGLTQEQMDAINGLWHEYQVDLSKRSNSGQLRIVPNSGHFMHVDQPGAIADAIRDVVQQVHSGSK
jgi:pimeloyl-ACP methyl ester carboxylesterase